MLIYIEQMIFMVRFTTRKYVEQLMNVLGRTKKTQKYVQRMIFDGT